jgi:hypothetical protein
LLQRIPLRKRNAKVRSKVYILLDLVKGSPLQAAGILNGVTGVKNVEILEGSPELLILIEARHRKQLAERTVYALNLLESMIGSVKVCPVLESTVPAAANN